MNDTNNSLLAIRNQLADLYLKSVVSIFFLCDKKTEIV